MPNPEMVTNMRRILDNYKTCKLDEAGVQCKPNKLPLLSFSFSLFLSLSLSFSLSLIIYM